MSEGKKVSLKSLVKAQVRRAVVYSGPGAIGALPEALLGLGCKRPFLVTDEGITKAGLTQQVADAINAGGEVHLAGIYDQISEEAGMTSVVAAMDEYRRVGADGFVGLGGGSVLDAVKFLKWMIDKELYTLDEILKYYDGRSRIVIKWPEAKPFATPFVAIPTAAGTGTEVSDTAVAHDDTRPDSGHLVIMDPYVGPDLALLDAYMTVSLPPHLTAGTGFDAFCHALEGFFSPIHNHYADAFALEAIKMIAKYLPIACKEPDNIEARQNMLDANILGICAFGLVLNTIPIHKMTLAFGATHQRHHGISNGTGMTAVMSTIPEYYLPRIREFAEGVGLKDLPDTDEEVLQVVLKWLHDLRASTGLTEQFANFSITEAQVEEMVDAVRREEYDLDAEKIKTIVRKMARVEG